MKFPKRFSKKPAEPTSTSWEGVARWYDDLLQGDNDTYQTQVVLPNLMRLLAPAGKRVIDIACGQGFFSRAAAEAGAAAVMGVDLSTELVQFARTHAEKSAAASQMKFEVAPASDMPMVASTAYDAGMIVLALQNIKEMQETVAEAARVLVPGGQLVVVLNHPCFRIPKGSAWGFDESTNTQYRRIDHYGKPFSVTMDMTPGTARATQKVHTVSFHRPLQDYVKAFAKAGFVVTGLEEWVSHKQSQPGPRAEAENNARVEFPLFLAVVLTKSSGV